MSYGAPPAFRHQHDELLRYRIVVGIKGKNLSDKLQLEPESTLTLLR